MPVNVFRGIKISGISGAVSRTVINNNEYANLIGKENVERIISVTGVKTHYRSAQKQTACDLGYAAAAELIARKKIDVSEVGLIIDITETPDYVSPSTAFVLHNRLNLPQTCMAFDVNLGCTGFVYGIHIASAILLSLKARYAIIVVGNVNNLPERIQNKERKNPDHTNLMMMGDGCAAAVLEKTGEEDVICTDLYGDGSGYHLIHTMGRARGMDLSDEVTTWSDGIDRTVYDAYMDGMGVFQFATRQAPKCILNFLDETSTLLDDYKEIFLHQANKMIVDRIIKKLKLSPDKVPVSLGKYGNTGGASIPITIIDKYEHENLNKSERVLLCGYGVGLSWGCVSLYIRPDEVFPMIFTDDYYDEGVFGVS